MARTPSLRSQLYHAARIMGDIDALSKGPAAFGRRYVRRKVYARSMGTTTSILRALNLFK